jgi:RNA binding exosome subunit
MTKENLIAELEAAKALTSVVSIDNIIARIQAMEPEVRVEKVFGISQELADKLAERIERVIDYNGNHLVRLDSAEFELSYDNRIELTSVDIDVPEIMEHVTTVLDEFIVEEDEEEEFIEAQNEASEEGVLRDIEE